MKTLRKNVERRGERKIANTRKLVKGCMGGGKVAE